MRVGSNSKNRKSGPKKKFTVESRGTDLTGIAETGVAGPTRVLEQTVEAMLSPEETSNEEKYLLIAEAAYFRAEKRSFTPGYELEDWLAAEAEIEMKLSPVNSPIGSQRNADTRTRRR